MLSVHSSYQTSHCMFRLVGWLVLLWVAEYPTYRYPSSFSHLHFGKETRKLLAHLGRFAIWYRQYLRKRTLFTRAIRFTLSRSLLLYLIDSHHRSFALSLFHVRPRNEFQSQYQGHSQYLPLYRFLFVPTKNYVSIVRGVSRSRCGWKANASL